MSAGPDRLRDLLAEAGNVVVLTGAGISTESGIPDFRSPGGIWSQYRIIEYAEFMASETARLEDWRRRFAMEDMIGEVSPNAGHEVIAGWVKSDKCACLITQNIDGLHSAAGTPDAALIEIHGNARKAACVSCGLVHSIAQCREQVEQQQRSPVCQSCGGIIKTAVVMFGEAMPEIETDRAFMAAESCDLFLAIGTSLVVQPASGLPLAAKRLGAKLAILNRDETPLDRYADLVVNEGIGETLGAL